MATRVLIVNADPALTELIEEWMSGRGWSVVHERPDLVVVDLPFPRERGVDLLLKVAEAHPRVPVVALSSNLFPGVESCGGVARQFGVACVLPKPLTREALVGAVGRVLQPAG